MFTIYWILIAVASIIAMFKLLPFFGIHKYWAFTCIIPLGTVAMLWWMALKLQELEKR